MIKTILLLSDQFQRRRVGGGRDLPSAGVAPAYEGDVAVLHAVGADLRRVWGVIVYEHINHGHKEPR